jgi:DMSO/TMAO reductase YedYZ molybdopterin-dependent catalytic subunit
VEDDNKGWEQVQRRDLLQAGALAAISVYSRGALAQSETTGAKLIPWSDQPPPPPSPSGIKALVPWEALDSWITPNGNFFSIAHYDVPTIDEKAWRLDVTGMVGKPTTMTLEQLRVLPTQKVVSTIECSGNNGVPVLISAIGNAEWTGTPLAGLLRSAEIARGAIEVVFYGADQGEEVVRKGTPREFKYLSNFARSMSIDEAMNPANMLCYEMNGSTLPPANGFPVRLIVPGWYGVANVKWLTRIEVRNTRFENRFMGRDYVTIREEKHDGQTIMAETLVGRMLLKSAPARVVAHDGQHQIAGMAWGAPIAAIEVKVDNGAWVQAKLGDNKGEFAWRLWTLDWSLPPGDHTVTSRAIDTAGNIQPAMDDPIIANKKTYWESNGQITRHVHIA